MTFFNNVEAQLPNELVSIFKIILILSHGRASIEKICVNNTILKDNTKYKYITARKTIIDHMKTNGLKAHIELLYLVKLSTCRYQELLRQQRKESKENETVIQLSLLDANIKEIKLRKKALIDFCNSINIAF